MLMTQDSSLKLWLRRKGDRFISGAFLERLINIILILAVINILIIFTGGYKFTIGPFYVSATRIGNPLLLFLAVAMVKVWLREKRLRIPASIRLRSPLLLFLIITLVYTLNGKTLGSGDTVPARYLPFSIIQEFDFDLDEFPFLYESGMPYFLTKINNHIVSTHPPWAAILALPVYILPVIGGISPQSPLVSELEKLAATLITVLSVVILFLALRRVTQEKIAYYIAIIYALGTSSFSTSSQGLWQHGPSQLFLTLTIYYLVRGTGEPKFSIYAGFTLASFIVCRPVNILPALPIGLYILHKHKRQLVGLLLFSLLPILSFMVYNNYYFGSPYTTGFASGVISLPRVYTTSFNTPLIEGLMGVLISPSRGLLIYSPIVLFSFAGMITIWRKPGNILLKYLSLSPLLLIPLVSKWAMWWGGHCYGPRMLADITPILCLFLYPSFERFKAGLTKYLVVILSVLSISLHALGAFGDGRWNGYPKDVDRHPERLWSWIDSPLVYYGERLVFSKVTIDLLLLASQKLPKDKWLVKSNFNNDRAKYAIDGDISTRWDSGGHQRPGIYFESDLGQPYYIKGLSLKLGISEWDFPRGYRVEVSLDGIRWIQVAQEESTTSPVKSFLNRDTASYITFSPVNARYIRITNTGETDFMYWSIHEIEVLGYK